jgi:hypothetical protein
MNRILPALVLLTVPLAVWADVDAALDAIEDGDFDAGIRMLETDARRNNVEAAYELGLMYRDGKGIEADPQRALEWLTRAAETDWKRDPYKFGLPRAQYVLGVMYLEGAGTAADAERAADWFERAAEQGHSRAQLMLAELYSRGERLPPDLAAAYVWASLAADSPDDQLSEKAGAIRDEMEKRLTPAALQEAKNELEARLQ